MTVWWLRLGIQHSSPDRSPAKTMGRHERMRRTLKAATARPPAQLNNVASIPSRPISNAGCSASKSRSSFSARPSTRSGSARGGRRRKVVRSLLRRTLGAPRRAHHALANLTLTVTHVPGMSPAVQPRCGRPYWSGVLGGGINIDRRRTRRRAWDPCFVLSHSSLLIDSSTRFGSSTPRCPDAR